jgi:hypothetical protein
MFKRALVGMLAAALVSLPVIAGPTLGIGLGWVGGEAWVAPSLGSELLLPSVGATVDINFAGFVSAPGWQMAAATFLNACATINFASAEDGPQWYGILGLGSPAVFIIDAADAFRVEGWEIGVVLGIGARFVTGGAVRVIAYINEDFIGLGINTYIDFFTLGRRIAALEDEPPAAGVPETDSSG